MKSPYIDHLKRKAVGKKNKKNVRSAISIKQSCGSKLKMEEVYKDNIKCAYN